MNIKLEDIVKRFGTLEAVSHVSLDIKDGELFTLLGPSGCGKTTILRLVGGFHKPDHGKIYFGDRDVSSLRALRTEYRDGLSELCPLAPYDDSDNIAYGLKLKKFSRSEIAEKISRALKLVNLTGLENRYPGQLSGGQQQRVALARALVLNPDVLLLDEPLSNLDAKIRIQVRAEIRKLQKELAITTIYVTHDQEEALTLSDRIAVINLGKLQQIGSPRDLYERPENPFVADFIGINNLIPGEVQEINSAEKWMKAKTKVGSLFCAYRRQAQARRSMHRSASGRRRHRSADRKRSRRDSIGLPGMSVLPITWGIRSGMMWKSMAISSLKWMFRIPGNINSSPSGRKVYVSFPIEINFRDSGLNRIEMSRRRLKSASIPKSRS